MLFLSSWIESILYDKVSTVPLWEMSVSHNTRQTETGPQHQAPGNLSVWDDTQVKEGVTVLTDTCEGKAQASRAETQKRPRMTTTPHEVSES